MTAAVKLAGGGAGILLIPILLAAAGAGILTSLAGGGSTGITITCAPNGASVAGTAGYSPEQMSNAATIVAVGKQLNVPDYGWVIALAAAMQESGLRNLNYGDRDSLGLFQQRPSQGWGNANQILNPAYAATQFYQHLLAVPNWQQMALTEAAQAVQNSGLPDAYAPHERDARQIVGALSGVSCANPTGTAGQLRTDWPPSPTPAAPAASHPAPWHSSTPSTRPE